MSTAVPYKIAEHKKRHELVLNLDKIIPSKKTLLIEINKKTSSKTKLQ
ncbi:MAG: hypothetical protein UT32_C0001G0139 [Parcubacteria group bacterium GW2011_GWC2_39_14]|nr:MAG: hypothetical protein UT32_C0001G0139 [Parcubacteria group bacterium GW2011_GWC2_39_14]KKR55563.1 MAG: hypothetical protein UT91_C0001G0138 [Parcubacteria group bacterium GW2011_GWA2_40_23]